MKHKCSHYHIDLPCSYYSSAESLSLLSAHVQTMRIYCENCFIYKNLINASDIAHLIIINKKRMKSLAIDTHVYSTNQQFRLLGCVKYGHNNPFKQVINLKFKMVDNQVLHEVLLRSLITNSGESPSMTIQMKNHKFQIDSTVFTSHYSQLKNFILILNRENRYNESNHTIQHKKIFSNQNSIPIQSNDNSVSIQKYFDFVNKLISNDLHHRGFIRSHIIGTRNRNVLIYNIGGDYRYCPRKGTHHLRNSTSILIDMLHQKFAFRCKDSECDNTILIWNDMSDFSNQ